MSNLFVLPLSVVPAFIFYCFISGITPGPANLTSFASAMKYGRKRALKQWLGLFTGYLILSLIAAVIVWFLGTALNEYVKYLSYIGALYIVWLAWHTYKSEDTNEETANENCNFKTGLTVQLSNVKVIIFVITALSSYVLPYVKTFPQLLAVAVLLPLTGPVCNLVWLFLGGALKKLFRKYRKPINIILAISLLLCAVNIILN